MGILLNIAHYKLAFHSNSGFDSQHIQNLIEQANQARYIFNATSIKDFLIRINTQKYISKTIYSKYDKLLLKVILMYNKSKMRNYFIKSQQYKLPESIKSYLEYESKILNASLIEVVDKQEIPKHYL